MKKKFDPREATDRKVEEEIERQLDHEYFERRHYEDNI